jgi:glycosyltransferase involved in cell wall biosynthesis
MKLGYTSTSYPPAIGGAQLHAHMLAQHLPRGWETRVVSQWSQHRTDWLLGTTVRAPWNPATYAIDGIAVTPVSLTASQRTRLLPAVLTYPLLQRRSVEAIAREILPTLLRTFAGVDLIHNFRIGREPLTYASALAADALGVPFVLTPFHHPRWVGWFYRVYHDLYRRADAVIALTQAESATLQGLGVRAERVHVIGHGATLAPHSDPDRFRQRHRLHAPFILFLGQKYTYKGFESVLEAAEIVWQHHPDVHVVFMGPRTRASESVFAKIHDARILELDAVTLEEKTDALAACLALCVPSTQESFGGVYVEAWEQGKPVIAADIPATRELVSDGHTGILVKQDAEEVAMAVSMFLEDPLLAAKMGAAGRERAREFGWDAIGARMADVYESLVEKTAGRRLDTDRG